MSLSFSSAAGGEIFNQCVADNDEAFTENDVIRLVRQILLGVAFLHRSNVVHLDLKVSIALGDCGNGGETTKAVVTQPRGQLNGGGGELCFNAKALLM